MKNNLKDTIVKYYKTNTSSLHLRILRSAPGWLSLMLGLILPYALSAQLPLTVNGSAEFGSSNADKEAHFMYNCIIKTYTD